MVSTLLAAAASMGSQYVVIGLCTFQVLLTALLLILTFPRRNRK